MKPVYIINGFLESGKTEFITYTISQPYFQIRGKTLLIVCEEGEVEYDADILRKSRTVMEVIDEESEFTPENLIELEKKYKPERIIVEYNGMWNCKNMKAAMALDSRTADYYDQWFYVPDILYKYEVITGRTDQKVRVDHL